MFIYFMNMERKSEVAKKSKKNKMKSHSGAKKRLSVTGTGKIRRHHSGRSHKFVHKSKARRRRLKQPTIVEDTHAKTLKSLIPYK